MYLVNATYVTHLFVYITIVGAEEFSQLYNQKA